MEIKSDRRTTANNTSSRAALHNVCFVEAANCAEKRSVPRRWIVRRKPWIRLLLCVPLFSAAATFAQYNPLPTPIAEQEVADPAQAAARKRRGVIAEIQKLLHT